MIGTGIFSSSQTVLSQVIEEFHDEYPLVKFDIYVGNADLIKERVDQGLVDIGILLEPVDISKYNHLRILLQEKWGIIVSKTNSLAHKPYVKKEDLKEKVSIVLYKNMPVTVTTIYKDDCLVKDDKGNLYTALFEQLMPIK